MFMKDNNDKYCSLYCSCGCDEGVILKAEKDECLGYAFSLVSDVYYIAQHSTIWRFKEKCRRIWSIIRNKEYYYFNIWIDEEDIKEFKEFVAKM